MIAICCIVNSKKGVPAALWSHVKNAAGSMFYVSNGGGEIWFLIDVDRCICGLVKLCKNNSATGAWQINVVHTNA